VICAPCGHENAANRRFCGACGAHLYSVCTHCAFQNDATDRFCGGCGDALPAERVLTARPTRPTSPGMVRRAPSSTATPPVTSLAPAPVLAVAPAPAPAPAHVAPSAPAAVPHVAPKLRPDDQLSSSELSDLLRRPAAAKAAAEPEVEALPDGAITQESLDALFGG
jgi:hypothetical protein